MENIIEIKNISKYYKKSTALENFSVNIEKGCIYGLVGRNGSGKTTLFKILTSLSRQSGGDFKINVLDKRRDISALIEEPGLYKNSSVRSNILFKCIAMGIRDVDLEINRVLDLVGLHNTANLKVNALSLGMKQRLGIALAILGNPKIILLDEPINGLDPQGIMDIRNLIINMNKEYGITFIISSHILDELVKVCHKFIIIDNGLLVRELSMEDIANLSREGYVFSVSDSYKSKLILEEKFRGLQVFVKDNELFMNVTDNIAKDINKELVNSNIDVYSFSIRRKNMEDYFLNLIGGRLNGFYN